VDDNKLNAEDNLTPSMWKELEELLMVLKPFMLVQRLLEGEHYVTISLVPYVIWKIRKDLKAASRPGAHCDHVVNLSQALLQDFNVRWGLGTKGTMVNNVLKRGTVFSDHKRTVGGRHVGLPLTTMMATRIDPRFGLDPNVKGLGDADDLEDLDKEIMKRMVEVALEGGDPDAVDDAEAQGGI
jgi:hypothetical protein